MHSRKGQGRSRSSIPCVFLVIFPFLLPLSASQRLKRKSIDCTLLQAIFDELVSLVDPSTSASGDGKPLPVFNVRFPSLPSRLVAS